MPDDALSSLKANFEFYNHERLLRPFDYQTPAVMHWDWIHTMFCSADRLTLETSKQQFVLIFITYCLGNEGHVR